MFLPLFSHCYMYIYDIGRASFARQTAVLALQTQREPKNESVTRSLRQNR